MRPDDDKNEIECLKCNYIFSTNNYNHCPNCGHDPRDNHELNMEAPMPLNDEDDDYDFP